KAIKFSKNLYAITQVIVSRDSSIHPALQLLKKGIDKGYACKDIFEELVLAWEVLNLSKLFLIEELLFNCS
ncbi:hypothetical protein FRX31_027566, partial [Thalictrum thalictroides]